MIRDDINAAQITAMKAGDKARLGAIRLMQAKIKDRDIELRTAASLPDDDVTVVETLQKMVKQRRESIALYEQGNRPEMAAIEAAEIAVIEEVAKAHGTQAIVCHHWAQGGAGAVDLADATDAADHAS